MQKMYFDRIFWVYIPSTRKQKSDSVPCTILNNSSIITVDDNAIYDLINSGYQGAYIYQSNTLVLMLFLYNQHLVFPQEINAY